MAKEKVFVKLDKIIRFYYFINIEILYIHYWKIILIPIFHFYRLLRSGKAFKSLLFSEGAELPFPRDTGLSGTGLSLSEGMVSTLNVTF